MLHGQVLFTLKRYQATIAWSMSPRQVWISATVWHLVFEIETIINITYYQEEVKIQVISDNGDQTYMYFFFSI